jgi:ribosomal protein L13
MPTPRKKTYTVTIIERELDSKKVKEPWQIPAPKEIFKQTVKGMDLKKVINAINGM